MTAEERAKNEFYPYTRTHADLSYKYNTLRSLNFVRRFLPYLHTARV